MRATKDATIEQINNEYKSPVDFVLSSVFRAPTARGKVLGLQYFILGSLLATSSCFLALLPSTSSGASIYISPVHQR